MSFVVGAIAVLVVLLVLISLYVLQQRRNRRILAAQISERTAELVRERDLVAELNQAKSELMASISEEFRAPLTLTLGPLGEVLRGRYGELDQDGVRAVETARANAARVLEMIDQLLDVARLESGGLHIHAAREDVGSFIRFVTARFMVLAERRQIKLLIRVPQDPVWIYFDGEQMDKVLTNLLANAFKATQAFDTITVQLGKSQSTDGREEVTISVVDTGRGITEQNLPKIFDRNAGSDRKPRRRSSTRLGLSLAKDLVELHGGRLEARSRRGEGSSFTAYLLPGRGHLRDDQISKTSTETTATQSSNERLLALEATLASLDDPITDEFQIDTAEMDSADMATADLSETAISWRPRQEEESPTILIADDQPDLRLYVRTILEQRYRVVEAAHGADALIKARQIVPDLVVSDVMMPLPEHLADSKTAPVDGYELTRALKEDPELDWLPVVLLTAKAMAAEKLAGLAGGADDYLTKPFDARELLARIDNLIAQRQHLRERFRAEGAASGGLLPEAERDQLFTPSPNSPPRKQEDEDFLNRVASVIDENLDDEKLNASSLARHLAVGRSLLYERLRELTGKSPTRLIMERRVERAATMLKSNVGNVSEVAYAVGFKSVSHFSRCFKERYGQTPTAFRG